MCMRKIKLTKLQIEILKSCLVEYREFLSSIDDDQSEDQYKAHQERYGKNLFNNIDRIFKKLLKK